MHFARHVDLQAIAAEKEKEKAPETVQRGFLHILRFNPNHDPKDGKFTTGAAGEANAGGGAPTIKPTFKPRTKLTIQQVTEALGKQGMKLEPLGTRQFQAFYRVSDKDGRAMELSGKDLAKVLTQKEEGEEVAKFDPNQPRDNSGRWTDSGAGAATATGGHGADVSIGEFYRKNDHEVTTEEVMGQLSERDRKEITDKLAVVANTQQTKDEYSKGGVYTAERLKLHKEIIDEFLNEAEIARATPAAGEKPTFVLLGGRGGSGKSAFTNGKINEFDAKKFIVMDNDKIKERLKPPYEGWNAGVVHEEASDLFDIIEGELIRRGVNVVHDATLKSKNVEKMMSHVKEKGYDIEGHYMYAPRELAAQRALKRYLGDGPNNRGRLVPISVILENRKNEQNFDDLKPYFKKWSAYDGRTDGRPTLIGRRG
jgi:predicted ABC-type ATPase